MADYLLLTERQQRLYDSIAAAARAGEVCPTNKAIAAASGLVSASAVADALGRLQRKGKVRVERFNRARVVHLPDLGLATATPPVASPRGLAPHWRERLPGVPLPEPAARAAVFNPPAPWRLSPPPLDWAPARCQYIAGAPSADEACKCGKAVRPGSAYCPAHHALCHRPAQPPAPARPDLGRPDLGRPDLGRPDLGQTVRRERAAAIAAPRRARPASVERGRQSTPGAGCGPGPTTATGTGTEVQAQTIRP
ncbi:MAG TPA: hypothetical protein VKN76_05405 [Kiloniellaceae bacterium]|nr:hypothetical protein [Kiloniellaceae bacterium]